jgi:hypothetical protein
MVLLLGFSPASILTQLGRQEAQRGGNPHGAEPTDRGRQVPPSASPGHQDGDGTSISLRT